MSRRIATRLKIEGELIADGPLHVGGMGGNPDVDLALAVDGKNRYYIPGTSIAGPVRAWVEKRFGKKQANDLFGPEMKRGRDDEGFASLVVVEDAIVKKGAEAIEIRDGVGINRFTGTAAESIKYDRAVLPHGSRIDFGITVEIADAEEEKAKRIKELTVSMLQALIEGEIYFGAARTRGLGRLKLENADSLKIYEQKLLSTEGIIAALDKSQGITKLDALGQANPIDWPQLKSLLQLKVQIDWAPQGALMVKAERDGLGVDMLPLTSAVDDQLTFVLPGSSIKGAFRNQAERLVRTLRRLQVPRLNDKRQEFLKQVQLPLIDALFGRAAKKDDRASQEDDGPPLPGLGALAVADCYAKPRFSRDHWGKIEQAEAEIRQGEVKSELQKLLEKADSEGRLKDTQMAMHVAIDRWTGGAADKFLYSVLEPHGVAWDNICLSLDLTRLRKEDQAPAVALLLLALRDLSAGRIPLGFAVNRGMGSVKVLEIKLVPEGLDNHDVLNCLKKVKIEKGSISGFSETLNDAWKNWCDPETTAQTSTGEDK